MIMIKAISKYSAEGPSLEWYSTAVTYHTVLGEGSKSKNEPRI
jgi:hypothetical protein